MATLIRLGSRGSDLALAQSRHIAQLLENHGYKTHIEIIQTQGDIISKVPLRTVRGTGFFTKELEQALLDGHIDLAVHSLKDLPTKSPEGLQISAIPPREDVRDVLLLKKGYEDLEAKHLPLRPHLSIGTSAPRRQIALRFLREDIRVVELRGNVPTRIKKLKENKDMQGIVLAQAGLHRLGAMAKKLCEDLLLYPLDAKTFVPAAAQGALAIQTATKSEALHKQLQILNDSQAAAAVGLERHCLAWFEGGCQLPLGIWAEDFSKNAQYKLHIFYGHSSEPAKSRSWQEVISLKEELTGQFKKLFLKSL